MTTTKVPSLSNVFAELASWILVSCDKDKFTHNNSLSIRIKADAHGEGNQLLCHLKVSTGAEFPVLDFLKDGKLTGLRDLAVHVQSLSDDHHFVVISCRRRPDGGEPIVSKLCVTLTHNENDELRIDAAEVDLRASQDRNEVPGTHLHLRLTKDKHDVYLEAKCIHDFLHQIRLLNPSVWLSFCMKVDGQCSRASYRYHLQAEIVGRAIVTDPNYYMKKAPLTACTYLGASEKHIVVGGTIGVECIVCFVTNNNSSNNSSARGSGQGKDKEASGPVSLRFFGPHGTPLVSELGVGLPSTTDPLTLMNWRTFGFSSKLEDNSTASSSACEEAPALVVTESTRLPKWAHSGKFVLQLNFLISLCGSEPSNRDWLELIRNLHVTAESLGLSDVASDALEDLFKETEVKEDQRTKSNLDVFIPMISESLASIFKRSSNPDFQTAVQELFPVTNSRDLEEELRESLWRILRSPNAGRSVGTAEKLPADKSASPRADAQLEDSVDRWEENEETESQAQDTQQTVASAQSRTDDWDDEEWFSQMEQELL